MITEFLGRIPFEEALRAEEAALAAVRAGHLSENILGFESEPVITLGARAQDTDLVRSRDEIRAEGFEFSRVQRGGQATLHNPGQLVIFPIMRFEPLGAREWVTFLAQVTAGFLREQGLDVRWDACRPGLYSAKGKVVALGLRLRQGISTHGLAINVHNDLEPFSWIRACGTQTSEVDRLCSERPLEELFDLWIANFKRELTRVRNSTNLGTPNSACARSSVG